MPLPCAMHPNAQIQLCVSPGFLVLCLPSSSGCLSQIFNTQINWNLPTSLFPPYLPGIWILNIKGEFLQHADRRGIFLFDLSGDEMVDRGRSPQTCLHPSFLPAPGLISSCLILTAQSVLEVHIASLEGPVSQRTHWD